MKVTKSKIQQPKSEMPDTIRNGIFEFPKYIFGGTFTTHAERQYEGWYKGYRVIAILFTRRNGESWGKGKVTYEIDGEKKIYKTVDELMSELEKRTLTINR